MCVVSMIGEHFSEKWRQAQPVKLDPQFWPMQPWQPLPNQFTPPGVTREEFNALKAQVDEMVALLKKAKIYDEEHNEPECEIEEKMALLRQVARLVGVDLNKEVLAHAKD